jgi:hypothetical protein
MSFHFYLPIHWLYRKGFSPKEWNMSYCLSINRVLMAECGWRDLKKKLYSRCNFNKLEWLGNMQTARTDDNCKIEYIVTGAVEHLSSYFSHLNGSRLNKSLEPIDIEICSPYNSIYTLQYTQKLSWKAEKLKSQLGCTASYAGCKHGCILLPYKEIHNVINVKHGWNECDFPR